MAYKNVSSGFLVEGDSYIDQRLLLTKEQMKNAYDEWFMPPVYIAYCLDDQQWYEYNENNEEDPETGFYKAIPSGIVKDVRIEGTSILDSEGVADFEFPLEDVLVNDVSVVENKKAKIDLTNLQEKLIAGENITISDTNVISATVPELKEGEGIIISEGKVKIDDQVVPKKDELGELVQDLGFVAADTLNSILNNYYTDSETYNKNEINQLISSISGGIELEVVAVLPITGDPNKIYLVRREVGSNIYDQYIWFNNNWVQVGSTEVDLSQFYKKDEIDSLLDRKQDKLIAGQGINITNNTISAEITDLPEATASRSGIVKYDNVTIKKNDDGQLYAIGGSSGGTYYEGDNVYFTTSGNKTYINADGYTAGAGISISNSKKITAKVDDETIHTNEYGELYMDAVPINAGEGISIQDGTIKIKPAEVADAIDLSDYQKKLTAGNNIVIDPVTNIISSTGGGGTGSANWGSIGGTITNQPDLMAYLNNKADKTGIPTKVSDLTNDVPYATQASVTALSTNKQDKLIAGANITISADNVISATGGSGGTTEVNWSDIKGDPLDNANLANQINQAKTQPVVYNGSFIVKRNGVSLGGMTANQSSSTSVDIKVPTFTLDGTVLTITNN